MDRMMMIIAYRSHFLGVGLGRDLFWLLLLVAEEVVEDDEEDDERAHPRAVKVKLVLHQLIYIRSPFIIQLYITTYQIAANIFIKLSGAYEEEDIVITAN
jgi:hypothetical protein